MPGTKAGAIYKNSSGLLPQGRNYKEFDINPPINGIGRDSNRFVVDEVYNVYLTRDHYLSFLLIIFK